MASDPITPPQRPASGAPAVTKCSEINRAATLRRRATGTLPKQATLASSESPEGDVSIAASLERQRVESAAVVGVISLPEVGLVGGYDAALTSSRRFRYVSVLSASK